MSFVHLKLRSSLKALVTGFEGWQGRVNPSGKIALELDGKEFEGLSVIGKELPENFYELPGVLRDLVRRIKPDILICSGWDYVSKIKVEKIGLNVMNSVFDDKIVPDNYGQKPMGERIIPRGSPALEASFPAELIVENLNRIGIPAYVSYHAGTHCCNTVMYSALYFLKKTKPKSIAGFIHLPPIEEMGLTRESVTPMPLEREREAMESALITCRDYLNSRRRGVITGSKAIKQLATKHTARGKRGS